MNLRILRQHCDDAKYHQIVPEMFTATPYNSIASFRAEVIHFGGAYRGLESEHVPEWITRFEALLSKLYWFTAVAHIEPEMERYSCYRWSAKADIFEQHERTGKYSPVKEWEKTVLDVPRWVGDA